MHIDGVVFVRMAMALPLLPGDKMSNGIQLICELISNTETVT